MPVTVDQLVDRKPVKLEVVGSNPTGVPARASRRSTLARPSSQANKAGELNGIRLPKSRVRISYRTQHRAVRLVWLRAAGIFTGHSGRLP